jgi:hypothetical protein
MDSLLVEDYEVHGKISFVVVALSSGCVPVWQLHSSLTVCKS